MRRALEEQGYIQHNPTKTHVDNKATLISAWNGKGDFKRSKSIDMKCYAIKELIDNCIVTPEWKPNDENVADLPIH